MTHLPAPVRGRRGRVLGVTAGAGLALAAVSALLVAVGHGPLASVDRLGDPATWHSADPTAALVPVVALAAWACAAWWATGLWLCALGTLPGTLGAVSEVMARRVTPAAVRRFAHLAVGATLVTGAAGAVLPASAATTVPTRPPAAGSWTDLDWPDSTVVAVAPVDSGTGTAPVAAPVPSPVSDLDAFGSLTREQPPRATASHHSAGRAEVVVVRGDTLWSVAARTLGPGADDAAIAAEWQRWYAANRTVVGADPDLLLPGQRLLPPPA